ncbi:MAG TPA: class I SAM-dependent methyltransferase [Thermotogota bacterium]|nr:class I SAM-dependent methyltransferase [Thermotogota bacterium]NLH19631.1 class I SAM-dependent methyltransferase [Thermotogaceae bacterium]OQC30193.1 MAG: Demethylmenaquinone methyltransferase [Thermotogota bacterium ADurb.Bin062]HNW45997.1 class I SAM-dependent methyltransferase [Thermotogota bacterium]HNY81843.1 class I SAM-dependent methyltransferase [Thermotogota bacterium]
MGNKSNTRLFNGIAPIYGLFYRRQKSEFRKVLERAHHVLDPRRFKTVLDVGCGTGALCAALYEKGFDVTGIDPAENMLKIARKKARHTQIRFIQASVLEGLPFADRAFDLSIASYVAHGLKPQDRQRLYAEMSRVTKSQVIVYDYNAKRGLLTTVIEWLERGDYFNFIRLAESEMKSCVFYLKECFSEVRVLEVGKRAAWYIGKPAR